MAALKSLAPQAALLLWLVALAVLQINSTSSVAATQAKCVRTICDAWC